MAQLGEGLPGMHEALDSTLSTIQMGYAVHAGNPSIWDEGRRIRI